MATTEEELPEERWRNPLRWVAIAEDAGIMFTPEMRRHAQLLRDLGENYGLSRYQRRAYLYLLVTYPDYSPALETILALVAMSGTETPQSVARAGLEWLEERLTEHHVTHLEGPLRALALRGLNAIDIAETFNDAGFDLKVNGRQAFGEYQVRRMAKHLGIKLQPVRWR